jgi:hypothetical protein
MDTQNELDEAIRLLENLPCDCEHPPAMIVLPPDAGFISGNPGGFVHLAIASLRAAQGQEQSFRDKPWAGQWEYDWMLAGLKPDAEAHRYLPTKRRKINDKLMLTIAAFLGIAILACFSVGLVDILHSISK